MEILSAALAFAITMLVLAMVVSTFVEMLHRIFSMREAGLKYMLGQMFDQVLKDYFDTFKDRLPKQAQGEATALRDSFVEMMSSNRAPMGAPPKKLPTDPVEQAQTPAPVQQPAPQPFQEKMKNLATRMLQAVHLWNGRDLASMTPSQFMERLGSSDFSAAIKQANDKLAGGAAEAVDAVLKDIAQKFEAVGKEASAYFEGRARLLSVVVAVVLAFAVHVDAIELFNTFLRNPSVRNNVIAQMDRVTDQYKQLDASVKAAEAAQAEARKTGTPPPTDEKAKAAQQQVEDTQKALKETVAKTRQTVSDLGALGVPIGWNEERSAAAKLKPILWNCPHLPGLVNLWGKCEGKQDVWVQAPTVFRVYLYLLIGGMLIGLGGPFWYSAITSLTSIRNVASTFGSPAPPATAAGTKAAGTLSDATAPSREQPTTPLDIFKVAHAAKAAASPDQTKDPGKDPKDPKAPGQGPQS